MSDRLKNTSNVSNEEIIDDLTRNLDYSLGENEADFVINPSSSNDDTERGDCDKEEKTATPVLEDLEKQEDKDHDSDADSFDEESLKDAEVDLTDDQKAERQILAEELKKLGNEAFKVGEYERSIEKYTEGLRICPLQFSQQRSILYCNRSAAKMKLEKYRSAVKDCTRAIELDNTYLKAYYRRAQSLEATEQYDESLADFKKILELDPSHKEAQSALVRLPPLIEARNEKLKTEMIGKLKDLGNMILKPFGLSTSNFKLEQDPESQGYKINFKQ
ncbi:tetratricopeptide repeat protein 1 [Epargyreus clarus]|uniref:tetratricopeptide repeat protein 1 n=1 Tax=Epargyreus clarus TaxID=520877 RepID=UPI003C2BBFFE